VDIAILPARCYAPNEWIMSSALNQPQAALPRIPEGVGTLGMIDVEDGIDGIIGNSWRPATISTTHGQSRRVPLSVPSGPSVEVGRCPLQHTRLTTILVPRFLARLGSKAIRPSRARPL
jgi:hypothetical protein